MRIEQKFPAFLTSHLHGSSEFGKISHSIVIKKKIPTNKIRQLKIWVTKRFPQKFIFKSTLTAYRIKGSIEYQNPGEKRYKK
ncbi:hypothetical protein A5478_12170 [Legionella pneumophila]|nr:hypothetical protein A5478_12170 [Legionella pneumophila]ANH16707.1 hypothetical protein A5480_12165 [Legionella pneumophila]ANH19684.1 hypothetical protein A5479_12220 [Legionella pneumophila]AOU49930.1 hypothetical protein A9E85_11975 [Legionella pneumophila]APX20560.1 hypothetical protein A1D14_12165 [Legionella pneumophila]